MIVTYFQCLTLRVRSGHLSNALTRERSWLTEKLVSPPYQSQSVVDSFTYYRRLPGCVVMGINRTRRLFGRQKKDAWAASQYTLYGFRPRCYHILSPLFLFFSLWSRKLHFRYAHRYFLDIYDTLQQSKENTFFSPHQQSVLQSTTFRPGCPSHFQVSNRKRKCSETIQGTFPPWILTG